MKRTFGGGEKGGRKVGGGGSSASTTSSSHSLLSRGSSGSGSASSGGSSGDKLSPPLVPWEFEEGEGGNGSPPMPPPNPIRAPAPTITTTTTTYTVPDAGLSSPVRTRLVFVYDPISGGVRVTSCLKAPPLLQPGLDSSGALGGEKRTIGTVTARALAVLREEGGGGGRSSSSSSSSGSGSGSSPLNPRAQVAFSSNDALLRGQSLKVLVNPALPSALVL